ncbi:MAG: c-type cytochrome [Candidatus Hodgkinia cicadicola]
MLSALALLRTWYVSALLVTLTLSPLALLSNRLFPELALGEASVAAAPLPLSASLKRLLLTASVSRGEKFYNKCTSCHSIEQNEPNKAGPNLWNIMSKNVAAAAGFNYSPALKSLAQAKWGFETLNKFLKAPSVYAKGTYMPFSGLSSPAERMDMLSYLNFKSAKPRSIAKLKFKR